MVLTYLGDSTLHNNEIWIIDVQLHRLEQGLDVCLEGFVAVEQVFRHVWECDLYSFRGSKMYGRYIRPQRT